MSTGTPNIPAETAYHVIWTFGREGGYQPDTFTQKLLGLLAYAEEADMDKLATVYPAQVAAVRLAKYDRDGIAKLQAIANGQAAA